jgi:hypothetical protein
MPKGRTASGRIKKGFRLAKGGKVVKAAKKHHRKKRRR